MFDVLTSYLPRGNGCYSWNTVITIDCALTHLTQLVCLNGIRIIVGMSNGMLLINDVFGKEIWINSTLELETNHIDGVAFE